MPEDGRYTLCHECDAQFYPGDEGFDYEECIECGGYCDTYGEVEG